MQLSIILTSLEDNVHVASLLGYVSAVDGTSMQRNFSDMHLAELLMKTLLRNLGFHTVCTQNSLKKVEVYLHC